MYSIEKTHSNDALCIAMQNELGLNADVTNVSTKFEVKQYFQSFRRHNTRAASIRIEDKKYGIAVGKYANGNDKFKALAWNSRTRTGQAKTKPSLELFKRKNPSTQLRLIKTGRVVYNRALTGHEIKFTPGDLAYSRSEGEVFTVQGWASTQNKVIEVGGMYHSASDCVRGIRNRGMCDYLRC